MKKGDPVGTDNPGVTKAQLPFANMKKTKSLQLGTDFVGGKVKKWKIPSIEGLPVDEFVRRNADDVFLKQEGCYEILHEREVPEAEPDAG